VYSFGVILYELVTGLEPWSSLNPMQVRTQGRHRRQGQGRGRERGRALHVYLV
jgi:hypothetical protein